MGLTVSPVMERSRPLESVSPEGEEMFTVDIERRPCKATKET
jgi:hypothetical protein